MEHPNIIRLIDSAIINNELYIVLEWAEKGDLKTMIKEAKERDISFSEENVWEYLLFIIVRFMIHIASGIDHMHKNRIMHRDLKPANILIDSSGSLKIADLGLGRIFGSQTLEVYSKVGTPLYMSPELLKGEGYDMKSDVWSIGCILYELCELKSPFRNDGEKLNLKELYDRIIGGKFSLMNTKKYSPILKETIYSMIQMNHAKRIDAETVVNIAKRELDKIKNTLKIDKSFVMEDIYYKLTLLDYENYFCKPMNLKSLSKIFFINEEEEYNKIDKFEYFFLLAEWIINCLKVKLADGQSKDISITKANRNVSEYDSKKSKKENAKLILHLLKNCGLKFSVIFSLGNLIHGYGDEVCYILNDLTTEILIKRNYEFKLPIYNDNRQGGNGGVLVALPDNDDDIIDEVNQMIEDSNSHHSEAGNDFKFIEEVIVNPVDWYAECESIKDELMEDEQGRMEDWYKGKRDNWSLKILDMKRMSQDIGKGVNEIARNKYTDEALSIQEELCIISDKENRLNKMNQDFMESVKSNHDYNRRYDEDIIKLTTGNKKKIEMYTNLKNEYRDLTETLKRKQTEMTDNKRLLDLKDTLKQMKVEKIYCRKKLRI